MIPTATCDFYKVNGTFPTYAPLYTQPWEIGKQLVVIGRGSQHRGSEVRVTNELKGWKWGYSDAIQSWGENVVNSAVNGGAGSGSLLQFTFSRLNGLYNEAELTGGDSGGGVFIKDGPPGNRPESTSPSKAGSAPTAQPGRDSTPRPSMRVASITAAMGTGD